MQKINFKIIINSPKEKVWDTMLEDATYRQWTKAFNAGGSYYNGDWSEGSKMIFLGPDPETGKIGGMVSRIAQNKLHEFISIEHLGEIIDGVEDTTSEKVKSWQGATENYTFKDTDSGTEVSVELIVPDNFKDYMDETWPKALNLLKEICERV